MMVEILDCWYFMQKNPYVLSDGKRLLLIDYRLNDIISVNGSSNLISYSCDDLLNIKFASVGNEIVPGT